LFQKWQKMASWREKMALLPIRGGSLNHLVE
jgi:hypothetical protein